MPKRKWIVVTGAFLLVSLLATGYLAIAAEFGSQDDPLVTLSYITDVLSPDTLLKVDEAISSKAQQFETSLNTKLSDFSTEMDGKITQFESRYAALAGDEAFINSVADAVIAKMGDGQTAAQSEWKVLKIAGGKTLTAKVGTEILLRIGSATCVSSGTPGLINTTTGTDLANGGKLAANNLYLVTVEGRGIKASGDATILIKGDYTVA